MNKNKIGGMVHKGTARQVQEGPQYIYLAKYSPLCRCMRVSCLSYLILLVIMSTMLIINTNYCGLDANRHTMRLRNVTYPIAQKGHNEIGEWPTPYEGVTDMFTNFMPDDENLKLQQIDSGFTLSTIDNFPLGIVMNATMGGENEIVNLTFTDQNIISVEDNGASFDIVIGNKKRKRLVTPEPWFNFDFWAGNTTGVRYNYTDLSSLSRKCMRNAIDNDNHQWFLADIQKPESITPVWFVDMSVISEAPQSCSTDYDVTIKVHKYFCYQPFIVRQVPKQMINFTNITQLNGEVIIDFVNERNVGDCGYYFDGASVDRIWLTALNEATYLNVTVGEHTSNVEFFVPSQENYSFYGLSGNASHGTQLQMIQSKV